MIRIIVVHELPEEEQNIVCQLFSARQVQVKFAAANYQQQSSKTSTLIDDLLSGYREEGIAMPYTMEDYERDYKKRFLERLSLEERLAGIRPEEIIKAIPQEELIRALPREVIERHLEKTDKSVKPAKDSDGNGADNHAS